MNLDPDSTDDDLLTQDQVDQALRDAIRRAYMRADPETLEKEEDGHREWFP